MQAAQGGPIHVQIHTESGLRRLFPGSGPGRPRTCTNLYWKWPPEGVSRQAARGGPIHVQIYTESGLRRFSPGSQPREAPYRYKFMLKVASGGRCWAGGPGRLRTCTNLCRKWPPDSVSGQAAQGGPVHVQFYTESGLRRAFPGRRSREAPYTAKYRNA